MADPSNRQSFLLKCQKKDGPVNFGEEKRGNRDTVFWKDLSQAWGETGQRDTQKASRCSMRELIQGQCCRCFGKGPQVLASGSHAPSWGHPVTYIMDIALRTGEKVTWPSQKEGLGCCSVIYPPLLAYTHLNFTSQPGAMTKPAAGAAICCGWAHVHICWREPPAQEFVPGQFSSPLGTHMPRQRLRSGLFWSSLVSEALKSWLRTRWEPG